jgi:hypothetical protein
MFVRTSPWRYLAIAGISVATVTIFQLSDLYSVASLRTRVEPLSRVGVIWFPVMLARRRLPSSCGPGSFSRVWPRPGSAAYCCFSWRKALLSALVRHWTREARLVRRTVIVGGGGAGEGLHALEAQRDPISSSAAFDDRSDDRSPLSIAGSRSSGTVDDLVEFARRTRIDLLLCRC